MLITWYWHQHWHYGQTVSIQIGHRKLFPVTVTSLWSRWRLKSSASPLFAQSFVQAQIKKTSLAFVWGESKLTGGFSSQRASNEGNVSIWWRQHSLVSGQEYSKTMTISWLQISWPIASLDQQPFIHGERCFLLSRGRMSIACAIWMLRNYRKPEYLL